MQRLNVLTSEPPGKPKDRLNDFKTRENTVVLMYMKIYESWLKRSKYKVTASKPAEEEKKEEKISVNREHERRKKRKEN